MEDKTQILLADDSPTILKLFSTGLTKLGYDVEALSDATDVVNKVQEKHYDVVLLDQNSRTFALVILNERSSLSCNYSQLLLLLVPKKTGVELAAELKKNVAFDGKVYLITGDSFEENPPGITAILEKPCSAENIAEVIETNLDWNQRDNTN